MKRFHVKSLVAVVAVLVAAVAAWAHYSTAGTGNGTGDVGALSEAAISVPSTSSGSHTVTFTQQAALSNASFDSQIKYRIQRKLDAGSFANVPTGPCSGELSHGITSCTDTVTTSGSYTYRVISRYSGWSATSADAGPVAVTIGGNPSPMVEHITRVDDSPTNAASVDFEVKFTENVTGVDATDFDIAATGGVTGATIDNVSGSDDTYTVTVGTGTGDGTLGLDLDDDDSIEDSANQLLVGPSDSNGDFTGETYAIDKTAPAVQSIDRAGSDPTNNGSVAWTVTFSEAVTGVNAADFTLATTGGVTGASITDVSGTGAVYTVTADTGTGSSTLGLNLVDDDSVEDLATNKLGGTGTTGGGDGSFTGQTYTIDKAAPTVQSIDRAGSNPTNAGSVEWTVTFSENVSGVGTGDFALAAGGGVSGASISSVTPVNGSTYTVAASSGSGNGTLGLNLVDDDSIADAVTNKLGGTGADNGDFTGAVFTIDKTAPTVTSINRANTSPTNAISVQWTVVFSENVTGVNAADFDLVPSGVSGASITNVTGSNDTYTVTVNTGTGSGTLGLDLDDDDSIADTATNKLGGTGADNGDFEGEVYTFDKTVPSITSINRADTSPTNAGSVSWTVTFSENVTGVNSGDFALAQSGGVSGATISSVTPASGPEDVYTVTVNTGSGSGTLGLNLVDDDTIVDGVGNKLGGTGTSGGNNGSLTGQTYTIDKTNPSVLTIVRVGGQNTNATSVQWTVTFSENVSGVNSDDFQLAQAVGVSGASITNVNPASGPEDVYTVTADTGTGDGTLGLNLVDDDSTIDGVGNKLGGNGNNNGNATGPTFSIDKTAPTVQSINRIGGATTNAATVQWTVTLSESVAATNVTAADFDLAVSGLGGPPGMTAVTPTTGNSATYTVTASTGSGEGTLGLNLDDDDTIVDASGNKLGGTGLDNGDFTGEVFTVDKTAPQLQTLEMFDDDRDGRVDRVAATFDETLATSGADVTTGWTTTNRPGAVTFSSVSVSGSTATLTFTGGTAGTASTSIGSPAFTIALSSSTGQIRDAIGNKSSITTQSPTDLAAPIALSIVRASGTNPTNASSVPFTVTFTEPVNGVDSGDFTVPTTGTLSGTSLGTISGSGATMTVNVNTGTGSGDVGLNLVDDDSIVDTANNNKLRGTGLTGLNNGSVTGQVYTVDKTGPQLQSLTMFDVGHDGKIEKVEAVFDEALTGSGTTNAGWTTTNRPGAVTFGATVGISGSTATLNFSAGTAGALSTSVNQGGATNFNISLSSSTGNIRDALGNKASFTNEIPTDNASPVPFQVQDTNGTIDGRFQQNDTFTISFTENVTKSAADSDVVLTDASPRDTVAMPGLLEGTLSTDSNAYITSSIANFVDSVLDQPANNQVRVTLTNACTSPGNGCTSLGNGAVQNLVVIPSTGIKDAANNQAEQNSASPTFSIRLF